MDQTPNQSPPRHKKLVLFLSIGLACFVGLLASIYIFAIPSKFELATEEKLPGSAKVVHADYDLAPFDQIHRFAISFKDDQARDLLVQKWQLTAGSSDIMSSSSINDPAWWPRTQLESIEQSGECYGRVDDLNEQWWTIWIDRNTDLLYLEMGNW